jgi:aspartate/methionine/tyrosine aminotransferase
MYTQIHEMCSLYLYESFIDMGLSCPRPEGAFYLFPDFQNFEEKLKVLGINGSKELAEHLLKNYSVAVLPGSDFYYPDELFAVRVAAVDIDGPKVYQAAIETGAEKLDLDFVRKNCPQLVKGQAAIKGFLSNLE